MTCAANAAKHCGDDQGDLSVWIRRSLHSAHSPQTYDTEILFQRVMYGLPHQSAGRQYVESIDCDVIHISVLFSDAAVCFLCFLFCGCLADREMQRLPDTVSLFLDPL
jgi:hypothetical protein